MERPSTYYADEVPGKHNRSNIWMKSAPLRVQLKETEYMECKKTKKNVEFLPKI